MTTLRSSGICPVCGHAFPEPAAILDDPFASRTSDPHDPLAEDGKIDDVPSLSFPTQEIA